MVDLPGIPDTVPELRTPQARVSPGEIAQPWNELAATLDKTAKISMEDIAKPLATRAGLQAVSRDDQGNLQVTKAPIFGDAADAYHRAVKFSALAQGEAEAKRQDLMLSKQFHNDPDSYLAAANKFRDGHVDQYTKLFGPDVGIAVGRYIDNATTYNYRWLVNEQQRTIKHNFDVNTQARIQSLTEDVISAIKTDPNAVNLPEIKAKIDEIHGTIKERVENPVLAAPTDVARLQLKTLDNNIEAAKFVGQLNNVINKDGFGAAEKAVDAMYSDKSIPPQQRMIAYEHGQAFLKNYQQNQIRQASIEAKQQTMADQMMENAIIQDSAGPKRITENDIKTNPMMSAAAKMRMLGWKKREDMPEPLAHVSEATASDLFRRMNLPEGDPNRINSLAPIREAYAPRDGDPTKILLKRADEEWLEKKFLEARTPEGEQLNKIRAQFSKAIEPSIDKSNPMLGKIDQDGKVQSYAFERMVDRKVDEYRRAGKSPYDLFDPNKPDFLGRPEVIAPFQIPLEQSIRKMGERITGRPAAPMPGVAPPTTTVPGKEVPLRNPGESPAEYLKRIGVQ